MPQISSDPNDAALHPAGFYRRAAELFGQDKPDEAVFWFYVGQLRYRFHLAARPDLPPDGDPALFGALSEQVGRPINEWAFGDPDALVAILDEVLAWDEATPNAFTPKEPFAAALERNRTGLAQLRDTVASQKQDILRQRSENGLPNRSGP